MSAAGRRRQLEQGQCAGGIGGRGVEMHCLFLCVLRSAMQGNCVACSCMLPIFVHSGSHMHNVSVSHTPPLCTHVHPISTPTHSTTNHSCQPALPGTPRVQCRHQQRHQHNPGTQQQPSNNNHNQQQQHSSTWQPAAAGACVCVWPQCSCCLRPVFFCWVRRWWWWWWIIIRWSVCQHVCAHAGSRSTTTTTTGWSWWCFWCASGHHHNHNHKRRCLVCFHSSCSWYYRWWWAPQQQQQQCST